MPEERDLVGETIATALVSEGEWVVVIDGTDVPLMSLAPGVVGKLQRQFDVSWLLLLRFPLTYFDVAEAIVAACAEKAGKEAPVLEDSEALLKLIVKRDADLPETPALDDVDDSPVDPT